MVAVYERLQVRRWELGRPAAGGTALFVAGYLLTWTAFGLLMWAVCQAAAASALEGCGRSVRQERRRPWRGEIKAKYYEACNCAYGCPCNISSKNGPCTSLIVGRDRMVE